MSRALVLVLLVLGVLAGPGVAQAQPVPRPVLVIGVAGLGWDDVGASTPAIVALAARGATGALSVKALPAVSCPADGWLTLGAGARAGAFTESCSALSAAGADDVAARNAGSRDGAVVGLLSMRVPTRLSGAGAQLLGAGSPGALVTVLDAGTVTGAGPGRSRSLRAADGQVAAAVDRAGPAADVLLVGLSESPDRQDRARLHVAIAAGPSFPRGALTSASTRRAGFVQLIDVAPTVLSLVGTGASTKMAGQPWQVHGERPTLSALRDLAVRAEVAKSVTVPFFVAYLSLLLLGLVLLRHRPGALRVVALAGVAVPGVSYAVMLVPWWRAPAPAVVLVGLVLVGSLALALLASAAPSRVSPVNVVCGATFALLAVDLLTGAHLQLEAPAGYSSLVAGRFAGIGNVAFGVYGAAALLAVARAWSRPMIVVGAVGLVAVVVDGAPPWGSDVGGVLALVPAFVVLGLLLCGKRVSLLRMALAGVGGAAVVLAFGIADYSRPAGSRTHLGRFVGQLLDGSASEVLLRKASAVLGLVFANPVTALLPLVAVGVAVLVLRPPAMLEATFAARPAHRAGLLAVGVLALVGFAVNDSGAAVVALAIAVAAPATIAVVAEVRLRSA